MLTFKGKGEKWLIGRGELLALELIVSELQCFSFLKFITVLVVYQSEDASVIKNTEYSSEHFTFQKL